MHPRVTCETNRMRPNRVLRWRVPTQVIRSLSVLVALAPILGWALESGEFVFEENAGRYSLEAVAAPVADILAHIEQATGIPIEYDEEDPGTTTQTLRDVDLERIMRLLGENVVMTFVADPTAPDGYRADSVKLDPSADDATRAAVARAAQPTPPVPSRMRRGPITYSGVGGRIAFTEDRRAIRFFPVVADAPIARSGITPEDVVIEIEGRPISSFRTLTDMSKVIRGKKGTTVTLTVQKANGAVIRQQVMRAEVTYNR